MPAAPACCAAPGPAGWVLPCSSRIPRMTDHRHNHSQHRPISRCCTVPAAWDADPHHLSPAHARTHAQAERNKERRTSLQSSSHARRLCLSASGAPWPALLGAGARLVGHIMISARLVTLSGRPRKASTWALPSLTSCGADARSQACSGSSAVPARELLQQSRCRVSARPDQRC